MNLFKRINKKVMKPNVWARPKMNVVFRAELMPGKSKEERTFIVEKVLGNDRVLLTGFAGEHHESEFESVGFD